MNKLFYIVEFVLTSSIAVMINFALVATIVDRGGVAEYFATNPFASSAIFLIAIFDLLIIFPAVFSFGAMTLGKSFEWCLDVIMWPFVLIDKYSK